MVTAHLAQASSIESKIDSVCDIMRRSNAAGAMQYIPELTWILLLRVLDELEEDEREISLIQDDDYTPTLKAPFRWRDWASPDGANRKALTATDGGMFRFVQQELFPHLKSLGAIKHSSARQRVVSSVFSQRERPHLDSERNFLDVLDKVDAIRRSDGVANHSAALSLAYESLLLKMGEKNNDGGQFFTPRDVIRAVVDVVDPRAGETVFDPAAGTGGFLAYAYEHIKEGLGSGMTGPQSNLLKTKSFFGKEKENQIYPICLANLMLHGIDEPQILHQNTLTGRLYEHSNSVAPPHFRRGVDESTIWRQRRT